MDHNYLRNRWTLCAFTIALTACDSPRGPTRPLPVEAALPVSASTQGFAVRVDSDTKVLREVLNKATRKALKNGDQLFGTKGSRTHNGVCTGMRTLLKETIRDITVAQRKSRSEADDQALIDAGMAAAQCGTASVYSILGRPSPSMVRSAQAGDYVDENLTENVFNAITAYADFVGDNGATGTRPSFEAGLTPLETRVFEMNADQLDADLIKYAALESQGGGGYGSGPAPYSVVRQAMRVKWFRAMARGCAIAVIGQTSTIISSARIGFFLGGPSGAALGAAATAVEACAIGAFSGWLAEEMFK